MQLVITNQIWILLGLPRLTEIYTNLHYEYMFWMFIQLLGPNRKPTSKIKTEQEKNLNRGSRIIEIVFFPRLFLLCKILKTYALFLLDA